MLSRALEHAMKLNQGGHHKMHLRKPLKSVAIADNKLSVLWKDGTESKFHPRWLWHQCPTFIHGTGQRLLRPVDIPASPQLATASLNDKNHFVSIEWKNGHASAFHGEWLHDNRYDGVKPVTAIPSKAALCRGERFTRRVSDGHPPTLAKFDYEAVIANDEELLNWLEVVVRDGACIIRGTPLDYGSVVKLAERVSTVQRTIYGTTFEVASMDDPINVAYSNLGLDLHIDLAYYESPPGLQLLHCLQFDDDVVGGLSQLLDGFRVAEYLRAYNPDAFHTLVTVPATLQKIHYHRDVPVHMVYRRPHIAVNLSGEVSSIFWAPPFEGPLKVAPELVEKFFDAYIAFGQAMLTLSDEMYEFRLRPGDTVVFNNRRMLHGRSHFQSKTATSNRVLNGCYVNVDEFWSRYRKPHYGRFFAIFIQSSAKDV